MNYRDYINTKLNEIASASDSVYMGKKIVFYVHENEGEFKAKTRATQRDPSKYIINAMLLDESTVPIAVEGLFAYEKRQTLEVAVPIDLAQKDAETGIYTGGIDYVYSILDAMTRCLVGVTGEITIDGEEYPFLLNLSKPNVGQAATYTKIGKAIPISVEFVWQIFKDGLFGNNVHIAIALEDEGEYVEALKIDGKVARTRTGDVNQYATDDETNENGNQELKTTVTQQALFITAQFPYKKTEVMRQLVRDALKGDVKREYNIKWYDGYAFTQDDPFISKMVAQDIQIPTTAGTAITITVTFTPSGEGE